MKKTVLLFLFTLSLVNAFGQIRDSIESSPAKDDSVYVWVAEKLTFNGIFMDFISTNIIYPEIAHKNEYRGEF